jgi:uncharacterized membrane protein YdjX (TVP38/TMEM64 family)
MAVTQRPLTLRHVLMLAFVVALAVALMTFEPLHALTQRILDWATAIITTYPVTGRVVFFVASAISAMAAFFSSAVVIPVAVYAWGRLTTLVLLWMAWLAGGCCSYAIGRTIGRNVASWVASPERVNEYSERITAKAGFLTVLLFQLALPSEIPGYVLGAARYPFGRYLAALSLAELPFAIGAVYLGESFVKRDYALLLAVGITGIALSALAFRTLHRRL